MENTPLTFQEISDAAEKRVGLITKEFKNGFDFIKNYPRSVTFFGSARVKEDNECYQKARRIAERVVKELHYAVATGGGPGIMEAANRGAFEAGGNSLGLTIDLPREQLTNPYVTDTVEFHYFFSRKVCLAFSAEAYIYFPGGFGTLDEFTEILTLIQTNKIPKAPIILVSSYFWQPLENFFKEVLIKHGTVEPDEISFYKITDDEDEVIKIIKETPIRFGVRYDVNSERAVRNGSSTKKQDPLGSLFKKIGF